MERRKSGLPAQPGNALLLAAFGGFTLWYMYDAWKASPRAENLVLIAPVGVLALVCIAVGAWLEVRSRLRRDPGEGGERPAPVSPRTVGLMAALVLYVALMPYVGFDAATFVFAGGSAFAMGERRPATLLCFSVLLTVIVVVTFKLMQPVPLPVLLDIWP